MRAREFITEQKDLPPEIKEPLRYTYVLPGLKSSDPYNNYRMGVAVARARSDLGADQKDIDPYMPEWSADTAFGENSVVAGFNDNVDDVVDMALKMTKTPGGKRLVSSPHSEEPDFVKDTSPIKAFKGYPR